jgi:hypothetical protein
MAAPASYECDMEEGTTEIKWQGRTVQVEPIPWYVEYLQVARSYGIPPWHLFDQKTPRRFWVEAELIYSGAEAAAREIRESRRAAMEQK